MSNLLINIIRKKGLNAFYKSSSIPKTSSFVRTLVVLQKNLLLKENSSEGISKSQGGSKDKNKKDSVKITLIGPNDTMSVTSLEDAQKLSKRRELKLIKIQDFDTKTQRPVYRLCTPAELLSEETNSENTTKNKKTEKNLTVSSRITDHDLSSRLKNIGKWLIKGYEVRILIQGTSDDDINSEKIFNKFENAVKDMNNGKIVQKRNKHGNIKFNIIPILENSNKKELKS